MAAITPRWWRLEARRVRTLEAGTPRAGVPEVVVVPGLGALGYLLPTVRACARWTRVHLLDIPGFGHPAAASCPSALADTARTAAAWLATSTASADRPVLLVGHSTGAQAALAVTVDRPEHVGALCLAGPTFPPEARRWWPLLRGVARTLRHEPFGLVPATLPDYLRGRRGVLTLLRTALADRPEDLLPRVSCPVLVVRGEHDAVCGARWAAELADAAPRGRFVTVPGAHNFTFSSPEHAAAVLRGFAGGG